MRPRPFLLLLAGVALVLMVAAVFFPFLDLSAAGLSQHSSVLDAITAFSDGLLLPLSFAVALLIVILPALRLLAILYAIAPMMNATIGSAMNKPLSESDIAQVLAYSSARHNAVKKRARLRR